MRLPTHKVYRAFPELDKFDDARCQAYEATARRAHRVSGLFVFALGIGLFVFCGLALYVLAAVAVETVLDVSLVKVGSENVEFVILLIGFVLGALLGLVVRDRWLRWIIVKQLKRSHCTGCHYQLLGLPVDMGIVICPECGKRIELASIGLTPEDILASKAE